MSSEAQRLRDLLDEVRRNFTRDDDLPNSLLFRIDEALAQQADGGTAAPYEVLYQRHTGQTAPPTAPDQFIQRARDIVKDHDDHAAGRAPGSPVMNLAQFTARAINLARDIAACTTDGRHCSTYVECAATGCQRQPQIVGWPDTDRRVVRVPDGVLRAIQAAGFTLLKTATGYELQKLGEIRGG